MGKLRLTTWADSVAQALAADDAWNTGEPAHDFHAPTEYHTVMTRGRMASLKKSGIWTGELRKCPAAVKAKKKKDKASLEDTLSRASSSLLGVDADDDDDSGGLMGLLNRSHPHSRSRNGLYF